MAISMYSPYCSQYCMFFDFADVIYLIDPPCARLYVMSVCPDRDGAQMLSHVLERQVTRLSVRSLRIANIPTGTLKPSAIIAVRHPEDTAGDLKRTSIAGKRLIHDLCKPFIIAFAGDFQRSEEHT